MDFYKIEPLDPRFNKIYYTYTYNYYKAGSIGLSPSYISQAFVDAFWVLMDTWKYFDKHAEGCKCYLLPNYRLELNNGSVNLYKTEEEADILLSVGDLSQLSSCGILLAKYLQELSNESRNE